jgi:hypothetical protein
MVCKAHARLSSIMQATSISIGSPQVAITAWKERIGEDDPKDPGDFAGGNGT